LIEKMQVGGTGACSAFSGLNAAMMLRMYQHCADGEWEQAAPYQALVVKLLEGLGPIFQAGLLDSAIERVLDIVGGADIELACQGPYLSATPELLEDFRQWCHREVPEWFTYGK